MNNGVNHTAKALKEFIKKHIRVQTYLGLVTQIVDMLRKLQGEGIQLILDMDKMYMKDMQIQFQLVTEESVYEAERIKTFLKEFTFSCVFAGEEDCSKVSEFMRFLDNGWNGVDLLEIKRFISGDTNTLQGMSVEQSRYPKAMPGDGETGVLDVTYWDNLEKKYNGQDNNGETGVLDPSFWENALNNTPSQKLGSAARAVRIPKLVHSISGKVIPIHKASFWIGKEDVDLVIDKDVISRKHAELIARGNSYFIVDNNSTNKTYVEGKAIPPKATVEIYNGTKVKFVDEEYTFYIE